MYTTTSLTLLEKVKQPNDNEAWGRFYDFYSPLIFNCARKKGCSVAVAEDVVQDTMNRLWRQMPKFHYDAKHGRFRAYLARVISSVIWQRFHHKLPTASLGELDRAFGDNGITVFNLPSNHTRVHSLVVQPDGAIVGAGSGGPAFVAHLLSNGTVDVSF